MKNYDSNVKVNQFENPVVLFNGVGGVVVGPWPEQH